MSNKRFKTRNNAPKTRKQLRKEARKNKKVKRNEYYTKRKVPGQYVLLKNRPEQDTIEKETRIKIKPVKKQEKSVVEDVRDKEKRQQVKLEQEMRKQRKKHLKEANLDEDKNIKKLEKQLKLNKRKSKSVPASFSRDGLDYLLEICDPENLTSSALAEQELTEVNNEFEEDLALMTEERKRQRDSDSEDDVNDLPNDSEDEFSNNSKQTKKQKVQYDSFGEESDEETSINDEESETNKSDDSSHEEEATWEDIYGRLRNKDGSVLTQNNGKYVPPGARAKEIKSDDEKLNRLKKQLKGLINRLAESNMHNIGTQIEGLYMNNSRNNMNSVITQLILDALVSHIATPERLLMEHILLIVILHANVGTEVGAHFLQTIAKQFDESFTCTDIENKKLDNITTIISQLYNFKLFDSTLIYDIFERFISRFEEKDIDCILCILRNVGFVLRKDNPLSLKNLMLNLQKKASEAAGELHDNSRVKFMLDVLLAIKNNNITKIPNYDTSYSEHLKKILKGFIRKGNYVTQLNISLEDLLRADEKGKWWVVGSAWTGNALEPTKLKSDTPILNSYSQKLLDLATKQRMNTDTRKNIFCVLMSAEDYVDAFEKLLRLSLKNQQEREIIHVILHCCLQEKTYNPYYATLAQKFCEHDRKYQMTIKYSIWDKLKALNEHSSTQISNLAKLLSHLFVEKGLPISTLKIVQFGELDKVSLRFIRQILLRILLHDDVEICKGVFEKAAYSEKLKMFRESLKLFLHHFLLKNLDTQGIPDEKKALLQQRVRIVDKLLTGKEARFR